MEGSIKRSEREPQNISKSLWKGKRKEPAAVVKKKKRVLSFCWNFLFDRITKDETTLLRDRLLEYSKMMVTYIFEQKILDIPVDISKLPHTLEVG